MRIEALQAVNAWISAKFGAIPPLAATDLEGLGRDSSSDGWRLPMPKGVGGSLLLLLDADFPHSVPRIFVEGNQELLGGPHVERSGRLCLAGDGGRVDAFDPVGVVSFTYDEAISLVVGDLAGQNREDFTADFDAYWLRSADLDHTILTWLGSSLESRAIAAWHGTKFYLAAESRDDCRSWMDNRFGPDKSRVFHPAAVIAIERLPTPEQYPRSASAVRALVAERSPDGVEIIDKLLAEMDGRAIVVLVGQSSAGVMVQAPILLDNSSIEATGKYTRPIPRSQHGFRPGNTPAKILAMRTRSQRGVSDRVDAWIRRMRGGEGEALSRKHVMILGCGSLGSSVAKLLLQSGVGHLTLIDPERLSWGNVGRHELGGDSVGEHKAESLAEHFRPMYPHAREIRAEVGTWQQLSRVNAELFANVDLVVSAIGSWNAESALNDLQRSGSGALVCPILYGWLEDQATAAHALVIGVDGPCLRCGFTRTGAIRVSATAGSSTDPLVCGAPTSIYGAVELSPAQALVATLAVDLLLARASAPTRRVWLAPIPTLEQAGRHWNPGWTSAYGEPGRGGALGATPWLLSAECPSQHGAA